MSEVERESARKGRGFFHIDRRVWKILCGLGGLDGMNRAATYLTIAAGTGQSNRISMWSAQAVEVYTSLHASRATAAIKGLMTSGLLQRGNGWSRTRPVYELMPFETVLERARLRLAEDPNVGMVMDNVRRGKKASQGDLKILAQLILAGVLWKSEDKHLLEPPQNEGHENLIWLPNTLVTGSPNDEPSPVRNLRSRGDLWALRLLVDLYHSHNLSADGGISRLVLIDRYKKECYGKRGRHVVWGFSKGLDGATASTDQGHQSVDAFWEEATIGTGKYDSDKNKIWATIGVLEQMGLIVAIPHLVENSSLISEPMHGFGLYGVGEPIERELAAAADQAARYIIGEQRLYTAKTDGVIALVPVFDTLPDVQMVGIYRLTYRPQTKLTSDWYRRISENAGPWLDIYKRLGPPARQTLARASGEDW